MKQKILKVPTVSDDCYEPTFFSNIFKNANPQIEFEKVVLNKLGEVEKELMKNKYPIILLSSHFNSIDGKLTKYYDCEFSYYSRMEVVKGLLRVIREKSINNNSQLVIIARTLPEDFEKQKQSFINNGANLVINGLNYSENFENSRENYNRMLAKLYQNRS